MSIPASSRIDQTASLVVVRGRGPLAAGLVTSAVLIVLVAWVGLTSDSVAAYALSAGVSAALGVLAVLLAAEMRRSSSPLLIADALGLATGAAPSVRMTWEETARVHIVDRGWRGTAIGVVPADLDALLTRSRPSAPNTEEIAGMLGKRERSQGAPLVVGLRFTGVDAAEAVRRLTALSAGRTTIDG